MAKLVKTTMILIATTITIYTGYSLLRYGGVPIKRYSENGITAIETYGPLNLMGSHIGPKSFLSVGGQTYANVRGYIPYFVRLPNTNLLFFVTEENSSRVTFHVYDTLTQSFIKIDGYGSSFGGSLGEDGQNYNLVRFNGTNELVLVNKALVGEILTYLNLKERKLMRVVMNYVDANTQVTNSVGYLPDPKSGLMKPDK